MQQPYVFDTVDRAYDTIIDVIDLKTGTLLISKRIDQSLGGFLADGRVISYLTDADGFGRVKIWALEFRARPIN